MLDNSRTTTCRSFRRTSGRPGYPRRRKGRLPRFRPPLRLLLVRSPSNTLVHVRDSAPPVHPYRGKITPRRVQCQENLQNQVYVLLICLVKTNTTGLRMSGSRTCVRDPPCSISAFELPQ